jgi:hypothetical protein
VFCILAPNGQDWLTSAHRGPQMVLGRRSATEQLHQYTTLHPAKADLAEALVQDFHTFRQALNVASADQRVLVLINADQEGQTRLRESLRSVSNDPKIIGRFHFDFQEGDDWKQVIEGTSAEPGIVLINPGEFGMTGSVMTHLPLDLPNADLITALEKANEKFAAVTKKKVYSEHVAKGQQQGVYFEGAVPYGEDRDGDGEIDHGGRGGGQGDGPPGRRER